jgi:hypothetical protein
MLQFVYELILWIVVPGVMLATLLFSTTIAARAQEAQLRVSAWSGYALGWTAFVVYIVNVVPSLHNPIAPLDSFPSVGFLGWGALIGGAIFGFFLLLVVRLLNPTPRVGFVTLALTGASTCAIFSYFFIANIRDASVFASLGVLIGVLLQMMLKPVIIEHVFAPASPPETPLPPPHPSVTAPPPRRTLSLSPQREERPIRKSGS